MKQMKLSLEVFFSLQPPQIALYEHLSLSIKTQEILHKLTLIILPFLFQ